ncbi:hypothetical protein GCM10027589_00660 [Actinocorallia lasiicapitis]
MPQARTATPRTTQAKEAVPALDEAAFAASAQRLTNSAGLGLDGDAIVEEWMSLYHQDAVVEWVIDGVCERHRGITAIRPAAHMMVKVWRDQRLHVEKAVECSDTETIVLSWTGGFRGRGGQVGIEVWTLRDGLVVHHRMHGYLGLYPTSSWRARLRILLASPRLAFTVLAHQRRAAGGRG